MRISPLRVFLLAGLSLPAATIGACHHEGGESNQDGGESACTASPTLPPVQAVLAARCAGASCHSSGPGGQFPPLADGDPSEWVTLASHENPGMQLVVPGHPEQSYLYMKVSGTQGPSGGALMPLGASMPIPEAADVHDWIAAGAPGSCSGADAGAPPTMVAADPNALDQGQLFTCSSGAPPASSPARLRRIDSPEWTYALPQALNGFYADTGYLNPFTALETEPYSTYASGVTIDTATLDLYFQNLPAAPGSWGATGGGLRLNFNGDPGLGCMFGGAPQVSPTDACIDNFVDQFLTLGVLSRAPTAAEHAHLRALLVTTLAAEGGDVTKRAATLEIVGQAAWLTSGALFRSEMGSPAKDPAGRNRLSNEELGLTVGAMLGYHRPGAPMLGLPFNGFVGPSDPDDFCHPWLHLVSEAVSDGTIQDPVTIKKLIAAYAGGVDPGGAPVACRPGVLTVRRRDLSMEVSGAARGEYWLAPRIAGFFREWLGYGAANTVFKDEPGLTSRFATTSSPYDQTAGGFGNLQSGYFGHESTLLEQMDDTVARAVIDATTDKVDVFKKLMTTTTFHVASDRADTNGMACTTNADCTNMSYASCWTQYGLCFDSIAGSTATAARVYNLEGVPATDAGRWVTLPATERSGVLTHPAWLTSIGDNFQDDPSLIHRGKWVRQNLFCESVPGLELVMVAAKLGVRSPTLSARDRVSAAIDPNPTCLGCHRLMNTLGYPFEMYDAAGFLRKYDKLDPEGKAEHAPDASSVITNAPDPALNGAVADAIEFTQKLSDSPYARRCFIRQAFRYFMGRDETMADQCTLASMESALDTGSFFDMLAVLASSDTVLYRTNVGGQP